MEQYINAAVEQFRTLLNEQIARERRMEQDKRVTDYSKLDKIIIGICGGDGIGPIISAESERLLQFILKDEIAAGKIELRTIEGLTIENRVKQLKSIPDDVMAEIKKCNVLLKGPTTVITDGSQILLVDRGCPGMATAGSGDVLSGVITALLGYSDKDTLITTACGAWIAGRAGEIAESRTNPVSMIASDTVSAIQDAVTDIYNKNNIARRTKDETIQKSDT